MWALKAIISDLSRGLGGIQLDYAVMLVNEAETAVRAVDPDFVFAWVTVKDQPSEAQLVERLTVVLYSIFGIAENRLVAGSIPATGKFDASVSIYHRATLPLCYVNILASAESRKAMRMITYPHRR